MGFLPAAARLTPPQPGRQSSLAKELEGTRPPSRNSNSEQAPLPRPSARRAGKLSGPAILWRDTWLAQRRRRRPGLGPTHMRRCRGPRRRPLPRPCTRVRVLAPRAKVPKFSQLRAAAAEGERKSPTMLRLRDAGSGEGRRSASSSPSVSHRPPVSVAGEAL